jgi:MFS family permease
MNFIDRTFATVTRRIKLSALVKLIEITSADWKAVISVFVPFSAGYFLSYFFRTINAVLAAALARDLALSASDLGLMTAVYFLTFAIIQLPLGILLDRFGPRRVQSAMLIVTAAGAMMFASGGRLEVLIAGRALIGLGAAGALIGGLKAIVLCFPKERVPLFNGCFIMLGTLGAVAATLPADWLLTYLSWRNLLGIAGASTAVVAVLIFAIAPEFPLAAPKKAHVRSGWLGGVFRDLRFWRLAPLSTTCISSAWAIQGLWAERWLADVDGLSRGCVVRHLFVMAVALSTGALLLGIGADQLRRWRIQPRTILGAAALVFISAELVLILDIRSLSYLPWALVAGMGAGTVLSYSILTEYFPTEITGQANAALNVFHIGGAFAAQEFIGWIIVQWPANGGHYPTIAYKTAFGLLIALQLIAIVWFSQLDQKLRVLARRLSRSQLKRPAIKH